MNAEQRGIAAWACHGIAAILAFFYFVRPLWAWATWDRHRNTLDLGFIKVSARPDFPSDARAIGLGLVLPVVLFAIGRILQSRRAS